MKENPMTPTQNDKQDKDFFPLTLRVPKELHERLTVAARSELRSANKQAILCLEKCLPPLEEKPSDGPVP